MRKKTDFLRPWLSSVLVPTLASAQGPVAQIVLNCKETLVFPADCPEWQKKRLAASPSALFSYESARGPVWVASPLLTPAKGSNVRADPSMESSRTATIRDAAGQALNQAIRWGASNIEVTLPVKSPDIQAALTGFEISAYRFKPATAETSLKLCMLREGQALDAASVIEGERIGFCTNVARHLINMPPNELTPMAFADIARDLVAKVKGVTVDIWEPERLKKEKMNLLLAVGKASAHPPCLLHLRYRPAKKAKPIALIGKGITFDSGGLDIKTAAGMRLMKKDMGGGAAVLGAFLWAALSRASVGIDAYIPLAENAIGSAAFRPSDVYVARNGQSVEISNTDAEGRLVLADALDVAVNKTGVDEPRFIIDLATLTGAIKVGLGSAIAGLFSNHTPLADSICEKFREVGDPVWRMPLYQKYRSSMTSTVADVINSVEVPFGGAVTAALFLENFVKEKPWAHLDIYAWKDSADGAWSEAGGSGQGVLGLVNFISSQK